MKNYKKLISAKPVLLAAIALIAIIVPMSASAANDAIVLSSGNAYVGNGPEGIAIAASYD
ncbi:MAG: hypothetical protein PUF72_04880 [Clostridiales bacterium]|nr:hypothetical protein [Clostridiales bacterium]